MYAKRNNITLAILWVLILSAGIFWINHENKKIRQSKAQINDLRQKLDGSIEVMKALASVEAEYQSLKEKYQFAPKQIYAAEEPSFSLHYFNWLTTTYRIPLEFDFELKDMSSKDDLLTFRFLLAGEGSYQDLYRFIWFITKHPLLYQIETFRFSHAKESPGKIEFSMMVKGFSLNQTTGSAPQFDFEKITLIAENQQFHNAFKSLIQTPKPAAVQSPFRTEAPKIKAITVDPNLVDIEKATLQAVANGRAYIKDQNGKLVTLKLGEKVRYGTLVNINQRKSEVEFALDREGTPKSLILGLGYTKQGGVKDETMGR